jgi:hypothetical protein
VRNPLVTAAVTAKAHHRDRHAGHGPSIFPC